MHGSIKRFAGKVMAITGFEQDQVLVDPVGQPGVNPDRDVSVPINWAYNHHFEAYLKGAKAELKQVPVDPKDWTNHGGPNAPARTVAIELPGAPADVPSSQWFSEGNGGESRKSFHGYPRGFAQLIHSPDAFSITPMQIDTRKRECGVTAASIGNCTKFERWLEPRQARYGRTPLDGGGDLSATGAYSGVLECPCTSRYGGDPAFYGAGAGTKVNGSICEAGGVNCNNFTKGCAPPWDGDAAHTGGELLSQRNPTCWSATYAGGLSCCGHRRVLLDADQDPGGVLLRYHMKFRFWFEEYTPPDAAATPPTPASHADVPRYYYQTEADAGEYDIPPAFRRASDPPIVGYPGWPASSSGDMHPTPGSTCTGSCPDGPDCECHHQISYHWTMSNASMIYAGGHCHAPSCLFIELYRNDTGTPELLCRQVSKYGAGDVGTDRFDELGYVALPPCLWGARDEGLEPPVWLKEGTPMFSVKRNRNTHTGHTGEMASWQMRGVGFPVPAA